MENINPEDFLKLSKEEQIKEYKKKYRKVLTSKTRNWKVRTITIDGRPCTVRGYWLWEEHWYSYCSAHFTRQEDCRACNGGSWSNPIRVKIENWVYKYFPNLYKYYYRNTLIYGSSFNETIKTKDGKRNS